MLTVDSDGHVIETERTWDFMEPADAGLRPFLASSPAEPDKEYWIVDGESWGMTHWSARGGGPAVRDTAPAETREMVDIRRRLDHMEELGIDVQMLYPTLFLRHASTKPNVDIALCRGYNRWLGHIWEQSDNRLRWAVAPPLTSLPDAIDEIRWGKEHGAAGVFMRCIEGSRLLQDPYFYPVYEEAERLNLPITVHIGNTNLPMTDLLTQHVKGSPNFWLLRLSLVGAFHGLALSDVPTNFPTLRFGFIEAAAQWLPFVANDLERRLPGLGRSLDGGGILAPNRFYVTCQTDDDIAYIIERVGEDNLLIGTDYGHNDHASELEALKKLGSNGQITSEQYAKIAQANPTKFYGL